MMRRRPFGWPTRATSSRAKTEIEEEEDEKEKKDASRKGPIFVFNRDAEKAAAKNPRPQDCEGQPELQTSVPFPAARGERSQKLDEDELKLRARAIEAKCLEFDVQGRVTQINPGPVLPRRIQAGSGHQVQPDYGG